MSAESLKLLELLETVARKTHHITRWRIIIRFNNRTAYRKIIDKIAKLSIHAQDPRPEITPMKKIIKRVA